MDKIKKEVKKRWKKVKGKLVETSAKEVETR